MSSIGQLWLILVPDLGSDRQVDVIVIKESGDGSTTVSKGSLIVPSDISLSPDTKFEIAGA
jgi:hypothetical protein